MNDAPAPWEDVYLTRGATTVSWEQPAAERTWQHELIDQIGLTHDAPILDVGGGASWLAHDLVSSGYRDLTVLDTSATALQLARQRGGAQTDRVTWLHGDLLTWAPERRYELWHDRAVFHFLADERDRARYRTALRAGLSPHGHVLVRTFASDGPERCSGRPVRRYDAPMLATAVDPHLTLVAEGRESHLTPAGSEQHFVWVLLRAVE